MELRYTIPIEPRTKKNHLRIAGSGKKCPACGRFLRQYILQSKQHDLYRQEAQRFLNPKPDAPIEQPVEVVYHFYMKTKRVVDMVNLIQSANDILAEAQILQDDNSKIIVSHDGTRVLYDKERPRTEILIKTLEGDANERENVYRCPVQRP